MIYFDNAASTLIKPKEVIKAINSAMHNYTANPGRSGHKASIMTSCKVNQVRDEIAQFFNAENSNNVIFTKNCTEALNLAIIGSLKPNSHIIITTSEHNSTIRPIFEMKEKLNLDISIVKSENGKITSENIKKEIKENTKLICTCHISNVDGTVADIKNIGKLCKENKILYLVDTAQSGGHIKIDMQKNNINILACAGHKGLFGPQGTGFLIFDNNTVLNPIIFGGTGTDSNNIYQPTESPECYESGTINSPGIIGLGAGISFVKEKQELITAHLKILTNYCIQELSKIENVIIYTNKENLYGIISFNIKGSDSSYISDILDKKYNICTRSGLHCAPLKHKELGTTNQGTVRISFSFFNTIQEIKYFAKSLKEIVDTLFL